MLSERQTQDRAAKQEQKVLDRIREGNLCKYIELTRLQKTDPDRYRQELRDWARALSIKLPGAALTAALMDAADTERKGAAKRARRRADDAFRALTLKW